MPEILNENYVREFFFGRPVLVLGSAACVAQLDPAFMESFPIIVRSNNYKPFNSCNRVDVYYSFLGGSVKKSMDEIVKDGAKLVFCRCPNADFNRAGGEYVPGRAFDARAVYKDRSDWFKLPYFIQTMENYEANYALCDRLLTTGVSSIIDILRYEPALLYVAGFDFFSKLIHNVDEPCNLNTGHNFEGEFQLVKRLWKDKKIEVSKPMQELFKDNDTWEAARQWMIKR